MKIINEKENIYVTKSFLPNREEYINYVNKIFDSCQLTNNGNLLQTLEDKLIKYFSVENLTCVTNGTIALQFALKALDITEGEVITTPFSYVATTSSILWERCKPVFVDIEPDNFTIDVSKIEEKITSKTVAIMPVHVFGYACNVEEIQKIADKHNLKVIYDDAHTFGCKYKHKSLVSYGDISTISFHATKLFHTVEGGACVCKDTKVLDKINLIKAFGHKDDEHFTLGINGKMSEVHAAMGLANFPYIENIIKERKNISEKYTEQLKNIVQLPKIQKDLEYNYGYYPVVFENEEQMLNIFEKLAKENIFPRRYFYPSLNTLPYVDYQECSISEDISKRIACLPLYVGLKEENIDKICSLIKK